jgi:uncharacterized membrane protein
MYLLVFIRPACRRAADAFAAAAAGAGAGAGAACGAKGPAEPLVGLLPPGVIGAVCAQTGAAIARAVAMATPVKRCFMLVSSLAVPDLHNG